MDRGVTNRGTLRRRVLAWVAAYALVLQSMLAPIVAQAAGAPDARGSAALEICLDHVVAAADRDQAPALPQQHDEACKLCIACALDVSLPLHHATMRTVAEAISAAGWPVVSQLWLDSTRSSGRSARGPPLSA